MRTSYDLCVPTSQVCLVCDYDDCQFVKWLLSLFCMSLCCYLAMFLCPGKNLSVCICFPLFCFLNNYIQYPRSSGEQSRVKLAEKTCHPEETSLFLFLYLFLSLFSSVFYMLLWRSIYLSLLSLSSWKNTKGSEGSRWSYDIIPYPFNTSWHIQGKTFVVWKSCAHHDIQPTIVQYFVKIELFDQYISLLRLILHHISYFMQTNISVANFFCVQKWGCKTRYMIACTDSPFSSFLFIP